MAASSDPETAAGLFAAATVSDGCGCVSLRGGLLSASGAAGRNGIAAVKDLKEVVAIHDQVIDRLITRIEELEARLSRAMATPVQPPTITINDGAALAAPART